MKSTYVYPGTFCPPTYGHLFVVQKAAKIADHLIIICSENPQKNDRIFTADDCKNLWKSYHLPKNVSVMTLEEFRQTSPDKENMIMIRGIRNQSDYQYEGQIIAQNHKDFGIDKYLFILADPKCEEISSSRARQAATQCDLQTLSQCVSPVICTKMLEKMLGLKNLALVVGRPGAGKTTFLEMICRHDKQSCFINADAITRKISHLIAKFFPGQDPLELVKTREQELLDATGKTWLEQLQKEILDRAPKYKNIFLEIPYAFQKNKEIWKYVGGKVFCIYCQNNKKRLAERGTPGHKMFLNRIPNHKTTQRICEKNNLSFTLIRLDGLLGDTDREAKLLSKRINKEKA